MRGSSVIGSLGMGAFLGFLLGLATPGWLGKVFAVASLVLVFYESVRVRGVGRRGGAPA